MNKLTGLTELEQFSSCENPHTSLQRYLATNTQVSCLEHHLLRLLLLLTVIAMN